MRRVIKVRPSSLGNYLTCPRSAWVDDHLKELDDAELNPKVMSINAKVGSCVHEFIGCAGEDYTALVNDWFNTNVVHSNENLEMSQNIHSVEDAVRCANKVLDAFSEHGIMSVFAEADHIHEGFVEAKYSLDSGKVMELRGRIDLYSPEENELIDVKTSGGSTPGYYGTQMAAYARLLKDKLEKTVEKTTVYFARQNKERAPNIVKQTYDVAANDRHFIQVVRLIDLADTMGGDSGDPTRVVANPGCWKCSEKWCRAYGTDYCPETKTTQIEKE